MSDFSNNTVNKKFRIVYQTLLDKNLIKSKSDIADKLGTYNHVINSILNGKRNITLDQMDKLIELFDINANYLYGRSEDIFDNEASGNQDIYQKSNITLVPVSAMAGPSIPAQLAVQDYPKFRIPEIPELLGELVAIRINGDSMLPNITNGDMLICEELKDNSSFGIKDNAIYIVVTTDSVVAKRVQKIKNNNQITGLRLISDNTMYPPYEVERAEILKLYKVKYRLTNYGVS